MRLGAKLRHLMAAGRRLSSIDRCARPVGKAARMQFFGWQIGCCGAALVLLGSFGSALAQTSEGPPSTAALPAGSASASPAPSQQTPNPEPAPSEPRSAPVPASPQVNAGATASERKTAEWGASYAEARRLLMEGHFAEARTKLLELSRSAPGPIDRELALELANLAGTWQARKVVLVEASDLVDSATVARRENRRTTDEIAVLYLNGVLYGLGSGIALDTHTNPASPAGAILPALALGGAGAGIVAALDSGRGLGYGVPQSIVSGMYLGLAEGIVWSTWNQAHVHYYQEWKESTVADIIWTGATVGAVAGGALSGVYGATPGRASYVGSTGLWSAAVIGMIAGAAGRDDEKLDDRALLAAALGLNAGAVAGVLTAREVSPSIARVRFLDLGSIAGGLVFGGIYLSAAGERVSDPRPALVVTALGIAAGFGTAWWLTRELPGDRLPTEKQSVSEPWVQLALVPSSGGGQITAFGGF